MCPFYSDGVTVKQIPLYSKIEEPVLLPFFCFASGGDEGKMDYSCQRPLNTVGLPSSFLVAEQQRTQNSV